MALRCYMYTIQQEFNNNENTFFLALFNKPFSLCYKISLQKYKFPKTILILPSCVTSSDSQRIPFHPCDNPNIVSPLVQILLQLSNI